MENKLERLSKFAEDHKITNSKWNEVFKNIDSYNPVEKESLIRKGTNIVWYDYQSFALKSFFIDNNIELTKQHFYTCGKLDEYQINKFNSDILDYGLDHLSYVLLSDCKELITRFSTLKHSKFEEMVDNGSSTASYVLQCLIKEDWPEYERAMEVMKIKTVKKFPALALDFSFYEALAEKHKTKVESVLGELVTPKVHRQRNKHHILLNEFISLPALGYTKLAWIKGINADVNSPLVPKELLPITPLVKYEQVYDFLIS